MLQNNCDGYLINFRVETLTMQIHLPFLNMVEMLMLLNGSPQFLLLYLFFK